MVIFQLSGVYCCPEGPSAKLPLYKVLKTILGIVFGT